MEFTYKDYALLIEKIREAGYKFADYENYDEFDKSLILRHDVDYNTVSYTHLSKPNFWLSCMIIKPEAMCKQVRSECEALYIPEAGKTCPTEILETLAKYNAEGRPIWKPMHMQPVSYTHLLENGDSLL